MDGQRDTGKEAGTGEGQPGPALLAPPLRVEAPSRPHPLLHPPPRAPSASPSAPARRSHVLGPYGLGVAQSPLTSLASRTLARKARSSSVSTKSARHTAW